MIDESEPVIWHRSTRRKIRGVEIVEEMTLPVSALSQLWSKPMSLASIAAESGLSRDTAAARLSDGSIPAKICGSMFAIRLDHLIGYRIDNGPTCQN